MKDLTNKKVGRLTVNRLHHIKKYGKPSPQSHYYWECTCECGNKKVVRSQHLIKGTIASCGCLIGITAKKRMTTHGMSKSATYNIWTCMRRRTTDERESYDDVKVCDRWSSFENFLEDMGERPSPKHQIDRIDPYGDYEPNNCRWVTRSEQMLNLRKNHHIYQDYLASNPVVPYKLYRSRLRDGWSKEGAASKPKLSKT